MRKFRVIESHMCYMETGDIVTYDKVAEQFKRLRNRDWDGRVESFNYEFMTTIEEITVIPKEMLMSGNYIVELRSGVRYIVFNDKLVGTNAWGDLRRYDDELVHDTQSRLDIVKLLEPSPLGHNFENLIKYADKVIWDRQEKTKEQLELEALGESIKEMQSKYDALSKTVNGGK